METLNLVNIIGIILGIISGIIFLVLTIYPLSKKVISSNQQAPFNNLSIILFVLTLMVSSFAGFFQYIALKQIEKTGDRGSGLAKFSIAMAWVSTSFFVGLVVWVLTVLLYMNTR